MSVVWFVVVLFSASCLSGILLYHYFLWRINGLRKIAAARGWLFEPNYHSARSAYFLNGSLLENRLIRGNECEWLEGSHNGVAFCCFKGLYKLRQYDQRMRLPSQTIFCLTLKGALPDFSMMYNDWSASKRTRGSVVAGGEWHKILRGKNLFVPEGSPHAVLPESLLKVLNGFTFECVECRGQRVLFYRLGEACDVGEILPRLEEYVVMLGKLEKVCVEENRPVT